MFKNKKGYPAGIRSQSIWIKSISPFPSLSFVQERISKAVKSQAGLVRVLYHHFPNPEGPRLGQAKPIFQAGNDCGAVLPASSVAGIPLEWSLWGLSASPQLTCSLPGAAQAQGVYWRASQSARWFSVRRQAIKDDKKPIVPAQTMWGVRAMLCPWWVWCSWKLLSLFKTGSWLWWYPRASLVLGIILSMICPTLPCLSPPPDFNSYSKGLAFRKAPLSSPTTCSCSANPQPILYSMD